MSEFSEKKIVRKTTGNVINNLNQNAQKITEHRHGSPNILETVYSLAERAVSIDSKYRNANWPPKSLKFCDIGNGILKFVYLLIKERPLPKIIYTSKVIRRKENNMLGKRPSLLTFDLIQLVFQKFCTWLQIIITHFNCLFCRFS